MSKNVALFHTVLHELDTKSSTILRLDSRSVTENKTAISQSIPNGISKTRRVLEMADSQDHILSSKIFHSLAPS